MNGNVRNVCAVCSALFATTFLAVMLHAVEETPPWEEKPLANDVNGYNPVPSPDGGKIAFVRLAWGREGGSGGYGSSNLITDVMVMDSAGKIVNEKPLADSNLMGWTDDGKNLICSRDWEFCLVDLKGAKSQVIPQAGEDHMLKSLHCGFLQKTNTFVWIKRIVAESKRDADGLGTTRFSGCQVETKSGVLVHSDQMVEDVLPSPDEKYLALFRGVGMYPMQKMWVYDIEKKAWADFGEVWGLADAWTPWFPDGSKLIIAQEKELRVCSLDGKEKRTVAKMDTHVRMPVVSPNGKAAAFITWSGTAQPNPGTTIWVVSLEDGAKPQVAVIWR